MTSEQIDFEVPRLFVAIQRCCFECIVLQIYMPFQQDSTAYSAMCSELRTNYNNVLPNDFQYTNKMGSGKYGLVVRCRKISTGVEYAMKIQTKLGLLRHFKKSPNDVMVEMRANSCCNHPYLTQLAYAFQNQSLVVMVMTLCIGGDLNQVCIM
mgnify:FL=1